MVFHILGNEAQKISLYAHKLQNHDSIFLQRGIFK